MECVETLLQYLLYGVFDVQNINLPSELRRNYIAYIVTNVLCNEWKITYEMLTKLISGMRCFRNYIQSGRGISSIIITDDYLWYKEPKSPYNFFSYLNKMNILNSCPTQGRVEG